MRLFGPIPVPDEKPEDGIGSIVPQEWTIEIQKDPTYNIANENCIKTVTEILNKVRRRFIRDGLPQDAVPEFDTKVEIDTAYLDGSAQKPPPDEISREVNMIIRLRDDPKQTPEDRKTRQKMFEDATRGGKMVLYSPYKLDDQLRSAIPVWSTHKGGHR